jgi:hypothetical protein
MSDFTFEETVNIFFGWLENQNVEISDITDKYWGEAPYLHYHQQRIYQNNLEINLCLENQIPLELIDILVEKVTLLLTVRRTIQNPKQEYLMDVFRKLYPVSQFLNEYNNKVIKLLHECQRENYMPKTLHKLLSVHLDPIDNPEDISIEGYTSATRQYPQIFKTIPISLNQTEDTYKRLQRIMIETIMMMAFVDTYKGHVYDSIKKLMKDDE